MAKWQVTHGGDFWEVYSFIGGIRRNWGGGYSSHAFPDAEQRAEKLRDELNERDRSLWEKRGTYVVYAGSVCGQFWGREDAESLAEQFVAMKNAKEANRLNQSEGHQQEREGWNNG